MIIELGNNNVTKKELCDYINSHSSFIDKYNKGYFFTKYNETVIEITERYIIFGYAFETFSKMVYVHWSNENRILYKQLPGDIIFRIIDKLIENYKLAENQLKLEQLKGDFK